ncbi:MAG: hypothetical protein M1834_006924 [Cirrosporium novae-zelandiae]|nr:MAG: hypothetical protein M1834_006924 [Cirrosporium novae-zelandiae]
MEKGPDVPTLARLPVTSSPDDVAAVIRRDGGVIIEGFITDEEVENIEKELKPHWAKQGKYKGNLHGENDAPLSGLVGKSRTCALRILGHPLYSEVAKILLQDITYPWWGDTRSKCISDPILAVSQAFTRGPNTLGQPLHRDDVPQHVKHIAGSGDSSLLGILVAGTKCTYENGGTQVIPGSHLWDDDRRADPSMCTTAEMEKGDACMIIGSIWHGAGANKTSDQRRNIYSCHMVKGFLRQDENQYLAIPREIVESYPTKIQRLIGYSVSQPYCGWVELDDPISMVAKEKKSLVPHDLQGILIQGPGSEQETIQPAATATATAEVMVS